jgi:hypothetical protein
VVRVIVQTAAEIAGDGVGVRAAVVVEEGADGDVVRAVAAGAVAMGDRDTRKTGHGLARITTSHLNAKAATRVAAFQVF